jgi:hypothetical protein
VHDYFEIVGVAPNARPTEVRAACGRQRRATHPDVCDGETMTLRDSDPRFDRHCSQEEIGDAAIDFVDAATLVEAMRADFFVDHR